MPRIASLTPLLALAALLWICAANDVAADEPAAADPASNPAVPSDVERDVERARREARMLDDIYKHGIVAITDNFVNDLDMIPAGTAFKQVFAAAEQKGWHKVRLVDATGEPLNQENAPEDAFEKQAIKKLVSGESWVETIEDRGGTKHLRVATPIPVVLTKCVMCHDNYEGVPKGQAIGALTYIIPIDGPLVANPKK
ncbi:DUF3365 domain-containing protein [Blastopirellula marina]|nr:DUF3365 domain-containing protein [Blastopirellula marina]